MAGGDDALAIIVVQRFGILIHREGHFIDDRFQLGAGFVGDAGPELLAADQHIAQRAVIKLADKRLHGVDLLAGDIRPGAFGALDGAGLQRFERLGERHLHGLGAKLAKLCLQHRRGLNTEGQILGILGLAQLAVGGQLLHAVVPVGQAINALVGHGVQQLAALVTLLEAFDRLQVIEQERQVKHLQLLGVRLELGQRRRQHLHLALAQCIDLLAITEQRRVRVNLNRDLPGQTLFDQFFEQQCTLALGGVLGHHMGELDHDGRRAFGQGRACRDQQCAEG